MALLLSSYVQSAEPAAAEAESTADAEDKTRLTDEQLKELGDALSILSDKSSCVRHRHRRTSDAISVVKERTELAALERENREYAEEAAREAAEGEKPDPAADRIAKRVRAMIERIDAQIADIDRDVGDRLNLVKIEQDGKISTRDVRKALTVIAHAPDMSVVDDIVAKLDVDKDGFVPMTDILSLASKEGLGVTLDKQADEIVTEGRELRAGGTGFGPAAANANDGPGSRSHPPSP